MIGRHEGRSPFCVTICRVGYPEEVTLSCGFVHKNSIRIVRIIVIKSKKCYGNSIYNQGMAQAWY